MVKFPEFAVTRAALKSESFFSIEGTVRTIKGLTIEAEGPCTFIGDLCHITEQSGTTVPAEIIGFSNGRTILMPLGNTQRLQEGARVVSTGKELSAPVGDELLGRILDGLGQPMDGSSLPKPLEYRSINQEAPIAMQRTLISQPLVTGVRAVDGLLTLGEGQRVGIFAGSGVGKSTLLGMIARESEADVNVICLVGERGREVREFIEGDLGEEGLKRSVIVCATSDQPSLVRIKAPFIATTIAEHFRDQGKRVMLMMDSVTRLAMAQRELGLSLGEPPSTKGYPPSVFAMLPKLMERAGMGHTGSITALYTVLVDADDQNEPIADASRSILDGHIVLNRKLTSKGHYPPIDILQSLSRTMPMVVGSQHLRMAQKVRELMASYAEVEDFVNIGAYQPGRNAAYDEAIEKQTALNMFLRQAKDDPTTWEVTEKSLGVLSGEEI